MIIAVDYDGTVVEDGAPLDPPKVRAGAKAALVALRRAGHVLVLFSCRSNAAHRLNWRLNPLWTEAIIPFDEADWERQREIWEAMHQLMIKHVEEELPGVFHVVDQGLQGKPVADVYLDDRAFRMSRRSWPEVAMLYGEPEVGVRGQG